MEVQDQSAVIAFLADPVTHGSEIPVEVIETHISLVFLAGDRAFKLKRAVKLPYADFSTIELRYRFCQAEFALNGRASPEIYRGVRSITRARDGSLAFDGPGEVVDYVVEMVRFSQDALFDRLAEGGRLTARLMEDTAGQIAAFHKTARICHTGSGSANMTGVLEINEAGFATSTLFTPTEIEALAERFRIALAQRTHLLDQRESDGHVRLCHGDLHLRNLVLGTDGPRMFDCIDFNDQIATCDTLYDLAFLMMDLWHRDLRDFASKVANRYLDQTGDDTGFGLLPFFMAVRAAVRAHVTATQVAEIGDRSGEAVISARAYFDLAKTLLRPQTPILIAIGGFSGSGKSTLAEALAPLPGQPPGARLLESDRIRKAMFNCPRGARLPQEAYAPDVSQKVYANLFDKAEAVVAGGAVCIVNAVFERELDRMAIERVAKRQGIPFVGIWLEAAPDVLHARIANRPQADSDATEDVLDRQLAHDPGHIRWTHLDAAMPAEALREKALELLA